ncbi:hypothetical protein [Amycolatopsis taiwanensis]|nr:hypothetical protein [Amycolatopsis taiwanensis]
MRHPESGEQISFIEVYVARVLTVLGLALLSAGSWWADLASQLNPLSR